MELEVPCKSPSDKKYYKTVELENGLVALLVKDIGTTESSMSSTELNDPAYKSCRALSNLRGDNSSACALSVNVGAFQDPENINGMAHLLEHMISMGSKKYPNENEFESFLQKHGGFSNAGTTQEYTTYYFTCHTSVLFQALDIFSQFFIAPLMNKDSIARERKAVDSEFQLSLNNDANKLEQILAGTASKENPAHKFIWGNMKTLKENITDDELYKAMREFHEKYYTADRMKLSILARIPLSTLENCALECFSQIRTGRETPVIAPPAQLFVQEKFNQIYHIRPIKDINRVLLVWQMPPITNLYRSKPDYYIGWLLEHEGKGGLYSYLRKKLWALNIQAGVEDNGFFCNSLYSLFKIEIYLTELGCKNFKNVIDSVFSYISFLKSNGPKENIFQEIKQIGNLRFKFKDEISTFSFVIQAVENMQIYPPRDILCGSYVVYEYNPDAITNLLSNITAHSVCILVQSKNIKPFIRLDKLEPWFNTQYATESIGTERISAWSKSPEALFSFPHNNRFIPTNFNILPLVGQLPIYPKVAKSGKSFEIWYKRDATFKLPIVNINMHLISPMTISCAKNITMTELYIDYLQYALSEVAYPAALAKLYHSEYVTDRGGLVLNVFGFSQKLPVFLDTIVTFMRQIDMSDNLFDMLKREFGKYLRNMLHYRDYVVDELRLSVLQVPYYNSATKCHILDELTKEEFIEFLDQLFQKVYIQCLVQGNILEEEAINVCTKVIKIMQSSPISKEDLVQVRVYQLPQGEKTGIVNSFNPSEVNSVISSYFQCGPVNIGQFVLLQMLLTLMEEPLFNQLRTKDQLGYDVKGSLYNIYGILGFLVTVHWQSSKYKPSYVQERIRKFMKDFNDRLKLCSEKEFNDVKLSLMRSKSYIFDNLNQEVSENWKEIVNEDYLFDRNIKEMNKLYEVKLTDVQRIMSSVIMNNGSKFREFTVMVLAAGKQSSSSSANSCIMDLVKLADSSVDYVTDIVKFKSMLKLYPLSKILDS